MKGSPAATWITSFFFPPSGAIWMSSFGRGLWTISVDRNRPSGGRCQFPQPPSANPFPDSIVVVIFASGASRPFTGLRDSDVCRTCAVASVRQGWITGLQLRGDTVSSIAISNGTITQVAPSGEEVPLVVENTYGSGDVATLQRKAGAPTHQSDMSAASCSTARD